MALARISIGGAAVSPVPARRDRAWVTLPRANAPLDLAQIFNPLVARSAGAGRVLVVVLRPALAGLASLALLEWCCAATVCGALVWSVLWARAVYQTHLLPGVPVIKRLPPARPPAVRADDPAEVRRWQAVLRKLGEAGSYKEARRWDWARAALRHVQELDPGNPEAAAMLAQMALEPEPVISAAEAAARQQEQHLSDFLGAAAAFLDASNAKVARSYLDEAAAISPRDPRLLDLRERLLSES